MTELILITGADGMLGASICRVALQQGYAVRAFIMPGRNTNTLQDLPIEVFYGDLLEVDSLARAMDGCQYVINVAANTTLWPRRLPIIQRVNFEGVKNIASLVEQFQIKRFIQIGTANSFDHGSMSNPGTEHSPFQGDQFKLDYIDSKYAAQQYLLQKFKTEGLPIIIVNPTYMIGPFDSGPTSGKMILELYRDNLPGYPSGGKNFVFSGDVALAVVNAITLGRVGECYIAGNENLSFGSFLKTACDARNKPFKVRSISPAILLCIGFLASVAARITRRPPKFSYSMAKLALEEQFYSPEKARKELGMPATPIKEAVNHCLTWWEENAYLERK